MSHRNAHIFVGALAALILIVTIAPRAAHAELPMVDSVEAQPLSVHIDRLIEALDYLGNPLPNRTKADLRAALKLSDAEATAAVQAALDPLCLIGVSINPESRVKVDPGPAAPKLIAKGWRQFLVKVHNEAGVTAPLRVDSPQAQPVPNSTRDQIKDRWLDLQMFDGRPMTRQLSGLPLEYRIIQLYSRDAGRRAAVLTFDVGQGTQDIGFRSDVTLTFGCEAATPVTLRVKDEHGSPTMASFVIRDKQGRVYPSQAKRIAPDFAFHPQVYRFDGEVENLPPGQYTIEVGRGPEYLVQKHEVTIGARPQEFSYKLERWIDPSLQGWWSGDHHIHAAGCKHYVRPEEGVLAEDMIRHVRGEDLKIGANLTWGPGFDYQKQFFTGKVDKVSVYPYLLRYDVEVSGFGSHRAGHLCLLRLREQMYPGGDSKLHWPTLGLNTLRWAKRQGAVVGPAHSGWGMEQSPAPLPSYEVPPFDGIGACEYIMQVTHKVPGPDGELVPAVDFMSTVDTPYMYELNVWYHTLNVGFRTRISGETDFPCIYGERVGLGRSYVKLDGKLDYDDWCEGIRLGRTYVSDGYSHLIDFNVGGVEVGTNDSELKLSAPQRIRVTAQVAARLAEEQPEQYRGKGLPNGRMDRPYWNVEWARIKNTRKVPVEVLVNGYPVGRKVIEADGTQREISFDVDIERSSWVAMRILPSAHTNPVFVLVGDRPIRASRRSVRWCMEGLEKCWNEKKKTYADHEMEQAIKDYDHARAVYRQRLEETEVE